jgi:hypothetical protein
MPIGSTGVWFPSLFRVTTWVHPIGGCATLCADAIVALTSETLRGGCEVGVRLAMSNECVLDVLGEHAGPPLALGIELSVPRGGGHGV